MGAQAAMFLKETYRDNWQEYCRSLGGGGLAWDYCILTASNDHQAEGFRMQLAQRREQGRLPTATHFGVVADPEGKRAGSGGATLGVLRYIALHRGKADFAGLRILVIHSGGDSRRLPQYSVVGKLFSPVPRELPDGSPATLFDEILISMSSMPARLREGMLLLSGDVLLLFNPLQVDYPGRGAAAISFQEEVSQGKNHGVFLPDAQGRVQRFLHKYPPEALAKAGAVNAQGRVDIDTGALIFPARLLDALYALVRAEEDYGFFLEQRLSLYGDFLFPMAEGSTLAAFLAEPAEGMPGEELSRARTALWYALRPFPLKLLRLAPAKFLHFGTTPQLLQLMTQGLEEYRYLGWQGQINSSIAGSACGCNSILSPGAEVGAHCYLEAAYVHHGASLGDQVILSGVELTQGHIPSGTVLHGLKLLRGGYVARIYGVWDDPKLTAEQGGTLFGIPIGELLRSSGIQPQELWPEGEETLWQAQLYPVCDTMEEAVRQGLNLYRLARGGGDAALWRRQRRSSLASGFWEADTAAALAWNDRMAQLVRMDRLRGLILAGRPAVEAAGILRSTWLTPVQAQWLERHTGEDAGLGMRLRLPYYVGAALGEKAGEEYLRRCFDTLRETVLRDAVGRIAYDPSCTITMDSHTVALPLRVNWGGGWSDTPPYCIEHGGTVLNAAILLDGEPPVEVTLERLDRELVVLESADMDVFGEFSTIEPLQKTGDPGDSLALQKAALIACGILPAQGGSLRRILRRLGGGLRVRTQVRNVPQGSGLGTSSILSAACAKGLLEFTGRDYTQQSLYGHVLCMEQLMGTGGGWQDQVGGLLPGVKMITSGQGVRQILGVRELKLSGDTRQALQARFALIYTGQRRLARNLLRSVVGSYVGNDPKVVSALNEIQRLAALMAFELERGDVDAFARLLDAHWALSKTIDAESTNTLIEQIFASVSDLIDGRMVCGAGGGGFLQVVLRPGVTHGQLHSRLKEVFRDTPVGVWPSQFLW